MADIRVAKEKPIKSMENAPKICENGQLKIMF